MVILQRWEPIISNTFPLMIPFWIRIKGLPLHYWQDGMVCRVGQELGTLENHELTKTTARVQVSVDGLKPLVKELIIEFDSGEETSVTLEYERLENHCSYCFSLLHSRRNCPRKREEEAAEIQTQRQVPEENYLESDTKRSYQSERIGRVQSKERKDTDHFVFQARVDRHGKPFGESVRTRQTRVPPPIPAKNAENPPKPTGNQKATYEGSQHYSSPQFTQNRHFNPRDSKRGRDLFPQRSQGQWRPKLSVEPEENSTRAEGRLNHTPREPTASETLQINTNGARIRSMEEVMEELHETKRQYLSCPDPVEAAARRQRVLQGDATGQMEETAASIIAAETRRHALIALSMGSESNPNTPPPNQGFPLNDLPLTDPLDNLSPQSKEGGEINETIAQRDSRDSDTERTPQRSVEIPAKLKSIVISPNPDQEQEETSLIPQEPVEQPREEDTLQEFQNKVKRRAKKSTQTRHSGNSPNILRGASSKKRNILQIHHSPARGAASPKGDHLTTKRRKATIDKDTAGTSNTTRSQTGNPPINLIPARTKRSSDFRASQHLAP
ncbi:hypothetical protein Bca4012_064994 [Brassica carinata]